MEEHCYTSIAASFEADADNHPVEHKVNIQFIKPGTEDRTVELELIREQRALRLKSKDVCFDLDTRDTSDLSILSGLSNLARFRHFSRQGELNSFNGESSPDEAKSMASVLARSAEYLDFDLPLSDRNSLSTESLIPSGMQRYRRYLSLPFKVNDTSNYLGDLIEAGRRLKLWSDIEIRPTPRDGLHEVLVETPNGRRNLADMGKGVHSILPLLCAIYGRRQRTTFLLQQPEISLHPSAQASLAQLMAETKHNYLIETHSDHILDRFRICVMEDALQPDELSIVYFALDQHRRSSRIHNFGIDGSGNLSNVPSGYRSFFMEETKRLLGFK